MPTPFDHEKLRADQQALRFVAGGARTLEELPAGLSSEDQRDRASASIVLNTAEGAAQRSPADRCRYFDIARGPALESAACLGGLAVRGKVSAAAAGTGKEIWLGVVSLLAGLMARFSSAVQEEQAVYGARENEND